MLPGSHAVPINDKNLDSLHSPRLLADAFSEFISAASLLQASYRDLQKEVAHLGVELAERNAALTKSLGENDRIRGALQQIIDSMPCGVLVLDTAETILTINPEGRRLLDLGSAPVGNLRELSAISRVSFESLVKGVEGHFEQELCLSSAAGKRWLAIGNRKLSYALASQLSANDSMPLHSIWILRDITASKQAEQERDAARSAMALAEISTILAHEIRNPLASMELFAGLIADDRGQTAQWISHLRAGIRLLSGTVNNVLSIHGGSNPHLVPIDLTACMLSGVEFVQPIAEQAGVLLTFVSGDDGLTILGSENVLWQIVLNLICNAIRHTAPGGMISVSTQGVLRDGRMRALVEVEDTGCGIAEHLLERIFDTGFSLNGDTPGLGLAVCKRFMVSHDGEIRVSSRVHCGSTFQLEFPIL
jgi:two-component system sensor histidine kinase FlrB